MKTQNETIYRHDVAKPFNIRINEEATFFPLHWHTFYEVELDYEGCSEHMINGTTYNAKSGFFILLTPRDFHKIDSIDNEPIKIKKFIFHDNYFHNAFYNLLQGRNSPCVVQLPKEELERISCEFDRIYEIHQKKSDINTLVECNLAENICLELFKLADIYPPEILQSVPLVSQAAKSIYTAVKYIENHFQEPLKLKDAAAAVHLSENYFSHYFKNVLGMSFSCYLKTYRVRYSTELLLSTDLTIEEVGYQSGFSTLSFFNRAFKEHYHISPSEYRKKYKKQTT